MLRTAMNDNEIRLLLEEATEYCLKWQEEKYLPYNDLEIEYNYGVIRAIVDYYNKTETKYFNKSLTKLGYNITKQRINGVDLKMYKKILYEKLQELFNQGGYGGSFENWMKNWGFVTEDGNREVTHHFPDTSLNFGFRHPNLRAFPFKFNGKDGVKAGIYIGGAYMEFNRVHREVDTTFSTKEIRAIAQKLIELADQVDSGNVTMQEYNVG